jgi:hypothetical protein
MWNPITGFMSIEVAALVAVIGLMAWLLVKYLD